MYPYDLGNPGTTRQEKSCKLDTGPEIEGTLPTGASPRQFQRSKTPRPPPDDIVDSVGG